MTALYRKYRPQTFDEVVGQEAVVRTLSNAIESGNLRQAYLFAGPRGTGKTSLARILAKSVNCKLGPTAHPDNTCHACVSISNGTSMDVIEMDAASQRGIDDIRDIRERVVLQPVEGRSKVYILDEAHQLTDAAWNALLKLIEEPPPHLLFIFCTTDLAKVLPTVRSRCQTFVFQRPRLPELVRKLRLIADAEGITVPDAALALVARGGRGAYRDAESTLDQLAASTGATITVQDVLALLGAVEDEVLFRLCDQVVDRDTAGALLFLEQLSEEGQDLGRLVVDLLEHLRHLMLVQATGEVPDTLPVTEESRERLREQANQLSAPTVLRMIDLLHVAVDDMRQGGDPRLPLELALVKVTRASSDLSRESLAYRVGAARAARASGSGGLSAPCGRGARAGARGARARSARIRPLSRSRLRPRFRLQRRRRPPRPRRSSSSPSCRRRGAARSSPRWKARVEGSRPQRCWPRRIPPLSRTTSSRSSSPRAPSSTASTPRSRRTSRCSRPPSTRSRAVGSRSPSRPAPAPTREPRSPTAPPPRKRSSSS